MIYGALCCQSTPVEQPQYLTSNQRLEVTAGGRHAQTKRGRVLLAGAAAGQGAVWVVVWQTACPRDPSIDPLSQGHISDQLSLDLPSNPKFKSCRACTAHTNTGCCL